MSAETDTLPPLEEQFVEKLQQRTAVTFGMWIFLATEVLFFGALLLLYSSYRIWYYHDFQFGSRHLDFALGTINTAVLLTSSFFMAGAVSAGRLRDRRVAAILLALTALLGVIFLGIKGYEWYSAIHDGFWPGTKLFAPTAGPDGAKLFFALYFVMTGVHGIHLIIGVTFVAVTAVRFAFLSPFVPNQNYLRLLGLYWHFVDIVWIFLYPLLYFIGRSS